MAARFWVTGGTGNWSSTTNWSATSGGASGASVPGSADTATFNASSGAGTATVDSSVTIQTLTMTGFTGTLAFGTNTISVNNTSGTVFTGATTYTVTGTPVINVISTGSTAITVSAANVTEANTISFNITGGTYALTISSGGSIKNLDTTGFSGSLTSPGGTYGINIYGNLTLSSTTTFSGTATINGIIFTGTSGIKIITTNNVSIPWKQTFDGVGGTWKLSGNYTSSNAGAVYLTNGTLNLDTYKFTCAAFDSNNSNVRTIAFGTGNITCTASTSVFSISTATNLTVTGTPVVNITYSGSIATTVATGILTEANSMSFNFTGGTYALSFLALATNTAKNVDFTGFSGSWSTGNANCTIYGNLTISTGMTITASAGILTFGATSGTQVITSNAKTMDFPLTVSNNGSGTVQLADALTLGVARTLTLTIGTLDLNSKTLTTGLFSSSNSNTRTLAFGTGNIICNAAGGSLWNTGTATGLTVTGTPTVNISNSGTVATTVATGALTEANNISFNFTTGTYALTFLGTASYSCKNANFTGFAGVWAATSTGVIYGSLTLATGMTLTASTSSMTFGATSGTQVITSNAKTIDFPVTFNGIGGTFQLADALLMGTGRTLTHTNGTLDLNGKTLTVGTAYTTATGTKNLTFNGGTLVCPTASTTSFNNAVPTGYTTTAGTGTGKISMTAATAKTFVGGGSTFNCTLSNDGAGALTVSGSNTFTTIANGVQPTSFVFPISITQTVTNWNVSGTAGNLVTIISGTAGTAATLSKASGTVSSNYLSLKDSAATGGASWYAGANSTNVSGNSGWIFSAAPANNAGAFFFMF
jgi:ribosomal protein S9